MNDSLPEPVPPKKTANTAADGTSDPWWKPGLIVFSEVTGWIVVPMVGALYLGQYLDERQGTKNLYFLILTAAAFIITCTGIGILGVKYVKQMEEQSQRNNHSDKSQGKDGRE